MKVFVVSSIFPNNAFPVHGIFMSHRLAWLARRPGIQLAVSAPVPYFPFSAEAFGTYGKFARVAVKATHRGIPVSHPRFLAVPKFGVNIHPITMAAALLRDFRVLQKSGFEPDVIDGYFLYPDGAAAAVLAHIVQKPLVVSGLGTDLNLMPRYRIPRRWIEWTLKRAQAVTTVSQSLLDVALSLRSANGLGVVVEHGVDTTLFSPPEDRDLLRKQLGMTANTLVSVGQLIERKGHHLAIQALADCPGVLLYIIGDGPQRRALADLARRLGLSNRVYFTGALPQAEVVRYMGAADLLINCADREGIANVLLEAVACGTPFIATPFWGSPELAKRIAGCSLFSGRSALQIASGIKSQLEMRVDRQGLRHQAMQLSWSETARQHYEGLIAAKAQWSKYSRSTC